MTTNGATLRNVAHDLVDAGLRRINVSLDSLRRDRFERLTRRDELARVLDGIEAAKEAGLDPVKVNVVLVGGVNDDEVVDFARFGRDTGVIVRFIEFMPLDADGGWQHAQVVPQAEIVRRIARGVPARTRDAGIRAGRALPVPRPARRASRAAWSVSSPASPGRSANRATASGSPPRASCATACSPSTSSTSVARCAPAPPTTTSPTSSAAPSAAKWAGHAIGQVQFIRPGKSMSQIGGGSERPW